jgi:hypothetical protein
MTPNPIAPSRRSFLRNAGAASALAPFLPLFARQADAAAIPRRLVIVTTPNGVSRYDTWFNITGSETAMVLSDVTRPLEPFKADMIAFDRFRNPAYGGRLGHSKACSQLLVGRDSVSVVAGRSTEQVGDHIRGTGMSIDHHIAKALVAKAPTKFPILNWGILASAAHSVDRLGAMVSYQEARQPVVPEINPYKMFTNVFGNLQPGMSNGGQPADPRLGDKQTILDLVKTDLQRLSGKLGALDRKRMDAHMEAIRAVERSLDPVNNPGAPTRMDCSLPAPAPAINFSTDRLSNLKTLSDPVIKMLTMALACDLTRVVTLQLSITTTQMIADEIGFTATGLHDRSHVGGNMELMKFQQWMAANPITKLLQALKDTKEADGTPLLDHTAVLWIQEFADASGHIQQPVPMLAFGKAGGHWKPGRLLKLGSRPHTDMFVSLCEAMGLPDKSFGLNSTGPITQLRG